MNQNTKNPRRDFLKTSALLTGGALLSPFAMPGAYAAGSDEIKIAVIGCGGRGTGAVFQALATGHNIKLVAMADAFRDRIDASYTPIATRHPEKVDVPEEHKFVGFDGYKKAIALADVVLLTAPPGFRPDHFEEAVKQGKHVFLEKPVATDANGIRRVLAAAEMAKSKKLNVVAGLQRRYQSSYIETVKRIQDGAIGDITGGQVYWNDGGVWVKPREAGQTEMEYQMRNWRHFNWLWAGSPAGLQIHNTDIVNWAKGSYPIRAHALGGRSAFSGPDHGDIFDHFFIEYEYADGTKLNSQIRTVLGTFNKGGAYFQGTKGTANVREGIRDQAGKSIWRHRGGDGENPYQLEHDQFFAAIRNDTPMNDTEWGAMSTIACPGPSPCRRRLPA